MLRTVRHNLLHLPCAAWCQNCVLGRGKDISNQPAAHRLDAVRRLLQCDYFFQGTESEYADVPALVCIDTSTGATFATQCMQKGDCPYTIQALASWILELGHPKLALRSDGEPAITLLCEKVKARVLAKREGDIDALMLDISPRDSHQSNGAAERAIQTTRGLMRTLISHLKRNTNANITSRSAWTSWAIRHAAWLRTRFHRRKDEGNLTAYERLKNTRYHQPILIFGEMVVARRPGAHLQKFASQHVEGLWLGRDSKTDEHLLATRAGVVRSRAVRRKPSTEQWNKELVQAMNWVPWLTSEVRPGRPPRADAAREPIPSAPMPRPEPPYLPKSDQPNEQENPEAAPTPTTTPTAPKGQKRQAEASPVTRPATKAAPMLPTGLKHGKQPLDCDGREASQSRGADRLLSPSPQGDDAGDGAHGRKLRLGRTQTSITQTSITQTSIAKPA